MGGKCGNSNERKKRREGKSEPLLKQRLSRRGGELGGWLHPWLWYGAVVESAPSGVIGPPLGGWRRPIAAGIGIEVGRDVNQRGCNARYPHRAAIAARSS